MTTADRPGIPNLFRLYALEELSERMPYSETYLVELKRRPDRINPRFRRVASRLLGQSEEELFGTSTDSAPPSASADEDVSTNQVPARNAG